jgi:hypothetical protein
MPAKDNVVIRMTSEDAGAFEAWRKAAKGPEAMGDAIEKGATKGKHHTDQLTHSVDHLIGKWTSVIAAIELTKKTLENYMETARESESRQSQAALDVDAVMRPYFAKKGISDVGQQQSLTQRVGQIAVQRRAGTAEAGSALDLLAGYKFANQNDEFAAFDELLQLGKAAGAKGADPKEFETRVLAAITRSTGKDPSAKSIRHFGALATGMFGRAKNYDPAVIIDEFANVADEARRHGMDPDMAFSMMTAIAEGGDPRQAKPKFREFLKPGMQKGEAEYMARARELMKGSSDYAKTVEIASSGPGAVNTTAGTAAAFTEAATGKISREAAKKNLIALMGQLDIPETGPSGRIAQEQAFEHPGGPFSFFDKYYSTEDVAESEAGNLATMAMARGDHRGQSIKRIEAETARLKEQYKQQILGKIQITLKTQEGRDVPRSVNAVGIQGR